MITAPHTPNGRLVRRDGDPTDLYRAAKAVMEQFEAGFFVRNTDSDGCSDWAIKAVKPLAALASLQAELAKAEGRR